MTSTNVTVATSTNVAVVTKKNNKYMALYKEAYRFYILYGGRSSGKSWEAVEYLIRRALHKKVRILCCREFQTSIRESVHRLLSDTICRLKVSGWFNVNYNTITCTNGSEFIFAGLFNNVDSIKSIEGVDICHVEEAHNVSKNSWEVLLPTIRKSRSEFVIVFNPRSSSDPTYDFVSDPYPNTCLININYLENPHNSEEVLQLADHCKKTDLDSYKNIWLGETVQFTKQQILADKLCIAEFNPNDWDVGVRSAKQYETYYGLDFGYSQDPTAGVRAHEKDNTLFIDGEFGNTGMEISDIGPNIRKAFPELERGEINADCSQPGTINHVKIKGLVRGIRGAEKWAGSVEDGILHLRAYDRIVVHPRCKNVIKEMNAYKWKLDTNQEITSTPMDKDNHWIDAIRYALFEVIKRGRAGDPWGF